jgi:integrase
MKIKCSVNFYLEKRKDKSSGNLIAENVPIFLYFSFEGKRMQFYTGYRIDENKWNLSDQRVKRNNISKDGYTSTEINDHLDEIRTTVTDIYKESKALKIAPSVQYIRDELKVRMGEGDKRPSSFFEVFDYFIESESQSNTWTEGTKKKFRTNYNHLKKFQESKHFKIEFDNIDEVFFNRYFAFLREEYDHRNTTLSKNLKILKWFLNWATLKKYNKNDAYKDYKPDLKGAKENNASQKVIFLKWDELMSVCSKKISKKYLDQVRDVFCFCCFTGLRYSDVYNLKRANIKQDAIKITTIKTDDPLEIDLNQYSRAILDKYKDVPFADDKCLPVISNQKMNKYLKDLGQLVELNEPETVVYYIGNERKEDTFKKWELLTTHVGRKTFVSNAVFFNIPAEVIMSWTGHKDHKVLEKYYKITEAQKRREMAKFNKAEKGE